jgi:hypothetical protein
MFGYFVTSSGAYYEGERATPSDTEVPRRPDYTCSWNGRSWDDCGTNVPATVTMRQARMALLQTGMLSSVQSAIDSLGGTAGDAARIEWDFSVEVHRARPLVSTLQGILGLTSAQVDDLFRLASTL